MGQCFEQAPHLTSALQLTATRSLTPGKYMANELETPLFIHMPVIVKWDLPLELA